MGTHRAPPPPTTSPHQPPPTYTHAPAPIAAARCSGTQWWCMVLAQFVALRSMGRCQQYVDLETPSRTSMVPLGAVHHIVIDCRPDARIATQACRCFFIFYVSLAAGGGGAWTILSPAVCRGLPALVAAVRARRAAGLCLRVSSPRRPPHCVCDGWHCVGQCTAPYSSRPGPRHAISFDSTTGRVVWCIQQYGVSYIMHP